MSLSFFIQGLNEFFATEIVDTVAFSLVLNIPSSGSWMLVNLMIPLLEECVCNNISLSMNCFQ